MSLILRNILINLFYYGVTLVALPWILLSLEFAVGIVRHPSLTIRVASILLASAGALLQFWCIALFHVSGMGTPSPAFAPKKLVTRGPYAWVRNPMNLGELLVFVALAAWFASPFLLAYTIIAALTFHSFIVKWEEPQHLRRFGKEYLTYESRVSRWIPKLKRAGQPK